MTQDTRDTADADSEEHAPPASADRTSHVPTSRRAFLGTTVAAASIVQGSGAVAAARGGGSITQETPGTQGYGEGGYGAGPYGTESDGPSLSDYTNENGIIDTAGLREAIDDWRQDIISTSLLRDVIAAWRTGDPID